MGWGQPAEHKKEFHVGMVCSGIIVMPKDDFGDID